MLPITYFTHHVGIFFCLSISVDSCMVKSSRLARFLHCALSCFASPSDQLSYNIYIFKNFILVFDLFYSVVHQWDWGRWLCMRIGNMYKSTTSSKRPTWCQVSSHKCSIPKSQLGGHNPNVVVPWATSHNRHHFRTGWTWECYHETWDGWKISRYRMLTDKWTASS